MAKLPVLSGHELIKILEKQGFKQIRQKGSHVILKKASGKGGKHVTVVPLHKEIDRGTLVEIIRQCGWKRDEFLKFLE